MVIRSDEAYELPDALSRRPLVEAEAQIQVELLSVLNRSVALIYQESAYRGFRMVVNKLITFYGSATYARQRLHRKVTETTTQATWDRLTELDRTVADVEDKVISRLLYDTTPDSIVTTILDDGTAKVRALARFVNHPGDVQDL